MIDLNDPDMREIVVEFCDESDALVKELTGYLEDFEDSPKETKYLESFGQVIDRIMGAAQTLGVEDIGYLCNMGKILGYKASQNDNQALNEMACGVLFDLIDMLESSITNLRNQNNDIEYDIEAFRGRLNWLADKFKHIGRASCSFDGEEKEVSKKEQVNTTAELDNLIKKFGKAS